MHVGHVMGSAMRLYGQRFERLHHHIRSLPAVAPDAQLRPARVPLGPGALVMGLLANRNIRPHIARMLHDAGDCPYVSDSTISRWSTGHRR